MAAKAVPPVECGPCIACSSCCSGWAPPRSPPTGRTTAADPSRRATRRSRRSRRPTSRSLKVAWTYDTRRRLQGLRDAVPAGRGARRPVCDLAEAARLRARRGHRRARSGASTRSKARRRPRRTRIRGLMYWERGDERRIYFGARHWLYALDATHGQAAAALRTAGPHRPAPGLSRTRSARAQHRRQHAGRLLRRPADPRLGRARGPAVGARRHPRLRRPHRRAEVGVPHDPAPGRVRLRHLAEGRVEVHRRRQRLGRPRRSTRSAGSSSPPPGRRPTTSTAPTATATTCSRTPSSACARPPASASGTSRP